LEQEHVVIERDRADVYAQIYREEQAKAQDEAERVGADVDEEGEMVSPNTFQFYQELARQQEARAIEYEAIRDGHERSLEIYDEIIQGHTDDLDNLLQLSGQYDELERDVNQALGTYSFLWDKENEARLRQLQAERLGYIQITEPARKPDEPVPSKMPQLVAVGGVVSILVGFLLSFVIEFLSSVSRAARKQTVS
jgi:uncharacterized protein involved in exopolysaccharide biosynthesis